MTTRVTEAAGQKEDHHEAHDQMGPDRALRAAHLLPMDATHTNGNGSKSAGQDIRGSNYEETTKPAAYAFLDPKIPAQMDLDFLALINSLEEEMARNRRATRRSEVRDRTILVGVTTGSLAEAEESMAELDELATSAGVVVQDRLIQRRSGIDRLDIAGIAHLLAPWRRNAAQCNIAGFSRQHV